MWSLGGEHPENKRRQKEIHTWKKKEEKKEIKRGAKTKTFNAYWKKEEYDFLACDKEGIASKPIQIGLWQG